MIPSQSARCLSMLASRCAIPVSSVGAASRFSWTSFWSSAHARENSGSGAVYTTVRRSTVGSWSIAQANHLLSNSGFYPFLAQHGACELSHADKFVAQPIPSPCTTALTADRHDRMSAADIPCACAASHVAKKRVDDILRSVWQHIDRQIS